MTYDLTSPCAQCPFLKSMARGFSTRRLEEFAAGEFHCHRTGELDEDHDGGSAYIATPDSKACAGALIYLEKRGRSNQMMRIAERLGFYDRTKLNMEAPVR